MASDYNPKFDWGFGALFGGLGALIWPAILAGILVTLLCRAVIAVVQRDVPVLLMSRAERQWRRELREREIQRAEKEVGL